MEINKDDPLNLRQAIQSFKSQRTKVMKEDIKSMKDNDIRVLVPLPEGTKPNWI